MQRGCSLSSSESQVNRFSLYLSGVRSSSISGIFFLMVFFFFWGPQKQAGISDINPYMYFWMYWSKVRVRTADVSVFECGPCYWRNPKGKIMPLNALTEGSHVPIYKSTGDVPIYLPHQGTGEVKHPWLRSSVQPTNLMQILWQVLLNWTLYEVTWWLLLPSRI